MQKPQTKQQLKTPHDGRKGQRQRLHHPSVSEHVMKGAWHLSALSLFQWLGVGQSGSSAAGDHDYFYFIFMLNKGFLGVSAVKSLLAVQEAD